ncbi:MAG: hypothetical protein RL885_09065 [Planctomycetota bacterium]
MLTVCLLLSALAHDPGWSTGAVRFEDGFLEVEISLSEPDAIRFLEGGLSLRRNGQRVPIHSHVAQELSRERRLTWTFEAEGGSYAFSLDGLAKLPESHRLQLTLPGHEGRDVTRRILSPADPEVALVSPARAAPAPASSGPAWAVLVVVIATSSDRRSLSRRSRWLLGAQALAVTISAVVTFDLVPPIVPLLAAAAILQRSGSRLGFALGLATAISAGWRGSESLALSLGLTLTQWIVLECVALAPAPRQERLPFGATSSLAAGGCILWFALTI